jgi:hypothetical protein
MIIKEIKAFIEKIQPTRSIPGMGLGSKPYRLNLIIGLESFLQQLNVKELRYRLDPINYDAPFNLFLAFLREAGFQTLLSEGAKYRKTRDFLGGWLTSSAASSSVFDEGGTVTFMATEVKDISFENLLYINGGYEDATELLAFMKSNASEGRNIYNNPNKTPAEPFDNEAIKVLKQHEALNQFITEFEGRQAAYSRRTLSSIFFEILHRYLQELYDIGCYNTSGWSFGGEGNQEPYQAPDVGRRVEGQTKIEACQGAKIRFFSAIESCCPPSDQELLKGTSITLRSSTDDRELSTLSFDVIASGRIPHECVISQQLYLWRLLLNHMLVIPPEKFLSDGHVIGADMVPHL